MNNIKIQQKKGLTLSDAFPAVLTVSIVAILIVALLYLFSALATIPANISYRTNNESVTLTTGGTAVANSTACGFANFAVLTVYNGSGTLVPASNYTAGATGTVANTTGLFGVQPWTVTYTYTDKGATCNAASSLTTNYTNQIPLVGLVLTIILIAIVIGVLVSSFFARNQERI